MWTWFPPKKGQLSLLASDPVTGAQAGTALAGELVTFTRRHSRAYNRTQTSLGDAFADIYTSLVALGCAAAIAVSFVGGLRDEMTRDNAMAASLVAGSPLVLPAPLLWTLLTYGGLAAILAVARRLGPIAVTGAQGAWWLPLPLDRRPMVLPTFRRRLLSVGLGATLGYVPFSIVTDLAADAADHALAAATFGAASVAVLGIAALLQLGLVAPRRGRAAALLALAPLALLPGMAPAGWPLAAAVLAGVVVLVPLLRRAGQVTGMELVRGGNVSGHAASAVFFLDTNELLRSMAGTPRPAAGSRARRFYARRTRGPFAGLVRADVTAFLRLQPLLAVPLLWLAACLAVVVSDAGLPAWLQLVCLLGAGCGVASGMGTVARRTALLPELDALLPLPRAAARASRLLMPALALAAWMTLLSGALALLGAGGPLLPAMGALAGIGMGAGCFRGATRPPADWTLPPVDTPMGPVPRAQLSSLLRGLDVTVLSLLPVGIALFVGQALPVLVMVQAAVSLAAVLVVLLSGTKSASGRQ